MAHPTLSVNGSDWIEFNSEWGTDLQSWRLYQSGQFVLLLAVWTDWDEAPRLRQVPYPSGRTFPLWDSLATFVAIYEFAARLSLTDAGSDNMVITTMIKNLHGAQLVQDHLRKTSLRHYVFDDDVFAYPAGKATPTCPCGVLSATRGSLQLKPPTISFTSLDFSRLLKLF